nr:DUF2971 domain-containing protein [Enterobacter kobei]
MNDKNEFRHGCLCFKNTIEYLNEDVISPTNKTLLKSAVAEFNNFDLIENERSRHVYSISFCRGVDKLSQWRGYGSSQGVSIEFNEKELINGLEKDGMNLKHGDVIYTAEDSTVEVNEKITDFFNKMTKAVQQNNKVGDFTFAESFLTFFGLSLLVESNVPFFKNAGFSEENEFRLVLTKNSKAPKVKFRVGTYGVIPYLNLKMKDDKKLPIKKVVIGPAKDKDLIHLGVRMLLDANDYKDVPIEFSSVPYRN